MSKTKQLSKGKFTADQSKKVVNCAEVCLRQFHLLQDYLAGETVMRKSIDWDKLAHFQDAFNTLEEVIENYNLNLGKSND